jgi:enamine deaminase RidA (YjgF/YER057c/UK114 family)
MKILEKIKELGFELPEAPKPVASYIPCVRCGNLLFTSGVLPMLKGELLYKGKIDNKYSVEDGYKAAQICLLNALSIINDNAGLDNVVKIVKLTGYVNSSEGFTDQPKVINGASDLLVEIFGEKGKHARSAVGVCELPLNASTELDLIVEIKNA